MNIPIKYGLMATIMAMAWVLIVRAAVPNPSSLVHSLGTPAIFNILHFVMMFLGLKALERTRGERLPFKESLKTGVMVSFVYAISLSLFFVGVIAVIGTRWLANEPGAATASPTQVAAQAFGGLVILTMIFGLIYSTVISFFLAKRRSDE